MILILLCSGCAQQSNQQLKQQSKSQSQSLIQDPECNPAPICYFHYEQKAKALSEQINGIDQAVAVRIDNELNVALQVSNFDRLRLQSLRKKTSQKLKASFPEDQIHVTTDSKLYKELEKLKRNKIIPN
ncbi:MAG: YhcN/YlaJ family sporulation lipoprotein [Paenibacillaceae bacterium]